MLFTAVPLSNPGRRAGRREGGEGKEGKGREGGGRVVRGRRDEQVNTDLVHDPGRGQRWSNKDIIPKWCYMKPILNKTREYMNNCVCV